MEPESSLPHSHVPATSPYAENNIWIPTQNEGTTFQPFVISFSKCSGTVIIKFLEVGLRAAITCKGFVMIQTLA
jgi:hypothetical protein